MGYQEALNSLQTSDVRNGVTVKLVPGRTEDGWLSDETRAEFQAVFGNGNPFAGGANQPEPTIQDLRDRMGSPNHSVAKHQLLIENVVIDGVLTRSYRPATAQGQPLPTLLFFHGGAYYGGSIETVDNVCRAFADFGNLQVFNVDYPLPPEHPFPAAPLAIYKVLYYLHEHASGFNILPDTFYVSGDSAGGGLSMTTTYLDQVVFQTKLVKKVILYYPDVPGVTVEDPTAGIEFKEFKEALTGFFKAFTSDSLAHSTYYGKVGFDDNPVIAVINAPQLAEFPPVEVIVGEFDPLRKSNEVLVEKLNEQGVTNKYVRYNGMTHAFLDHLGDYPQAEDAIKEAIKFINE
ncbi:alpha/beta hydrolase [Limosilactobacillus fermentum]|nr:alpha/beta hydrolase [Limosilactobacillus fermentum]